MRVALIVPTHHYRSNYTPLSISDFPAGFAYLASSLKQAGHEVIGVNPNNRPGYPSNRIMLQDVLARAVINVGLVGIGGLATDYAFLSDAVSILRSITRAPVVLGGQIVTNDAEFIFNDLRPDYAIVGEADQAIVELCEALEGKRSLDSVSNLWYWREDAVQE